MKDEESLVNFLTGLGARNALAASAVSLAMLAVLVLMLVPEESRFHVFVPIAVLSTAIRALLAHLSMPARGDDGEQ